MDPKLIQNLLTIVNQIKFYHWQTTSFARHKALGKAYDTLNDLIDTFVEICIGKYGRDFLQSLSINIHSKQEVDMSAALNEITSYLKELSNLLDPQNDTDLINLRDEMLGVVNQTKYLFTLK